MSPSPVNPFGKFETVTIGGFPLRKYGSLRQFEEDWFEDQDMARLDFGLKALELANKIAADQGVAEAKAIELVQSLGQGAEDSAEILLPYLAEVRELQEGLRTQRNSATAIATMLISSRVGWAWLEKHAGDLYEAFDLELGEDATEWTEEHTRRLPKNLIEEIALFAARERNGWRKVEVDTTPVDEADQSLGEGSRASAAKGRRSKQTGGGFTKKSNSPESLTPPGESTDLETNPST